MKRFLIYSLILTAAFFIPNKARTQTWGNNNESLIPISNNLINGLISASPPTTTIVQGDLLYYTDYYGLNIFDVSNPQSPERISNTPLPGKVLHFQLSGDYAYICNESGVEFVNVSDPALPVVEDIRFVGFRPYSIIVEESTLYLASAEGVYSYAITENHGMNLLNQIYIQPAASTFAGFVKYGQYIYYTNQRHLHVLDVSNPQNIINVYSREYNGGGSSWGNLQIEGDYLYAPTTLSMHIFNISNPSVPNLVYAGLPTNHSIYEVTVENNIMILNHNSNGKFTIFDVSDPSNPELRYAHTESWFNHLYRLGTLKNNILYVMDNEQEGYNGYTIHLIDISSNTAPVQAGSILSMAGLTKSVSLFKKNNQTYAFVAQSNSGVNHESGLFRIMNVTHADEPYIESTNEIGSTIISACVLNDNWAVLTSSIYNFPYYSLYLTLVNIENPATPYVADVLPFGTNHLIANNSNVSSFGGVGYAVSKTHLNIFKENQGAISIAGSVSLYGENGIGVYANNPNFVYVAGGNYGFQMYNVSNPSNPYMVNFHQTNGTCWDVYVDNGIAYVAALNGGLATYDVSQNMIVPLGQTVAYGQATSVVVLDKIAYVGLQDGRIQLFDITNPAQPVSKGWYLTNGTKINDMVMDLDPGKSHLYVANELEMLILQMDYYVGEQEVIIPEAEIRVYPNPAREKAVFEINLSKGADVEMKLYNTTGQLVGTVVKSYMVAGVAQLEYNTQNLPGGLYIVELHYDGIRLTDKLIVGNK
jgi:hypothetical protein